MTITDLIEKLTELRAEHGDLLVLVDGYEDDMDAVRPPRPLDVFDKGEDVKKCQWWSGRYGEADGCDHEGEPTFTAAVISR